ncbi:ATP-grasp domain-containing protein [Lachnoclostridium sp. Marseille-P6806]|uniref:ATP-grasp domain-containing protein n=1 Tax=Lachnoclostridium sp. Marseille-P6806 TaxID=2364793 RepID=UPI001031FC8C|nr:ATP-grasp domain-containing protein [Lachnoclostridium sp. Marseille-P6806]
MAVNILILSAGTRNKIVQFYKEALRGRGKVVATDCSPYAPALYDADAWEIVPRIDATDYLERIYAVIRKWKITGALSLIDPELSLLAAHAEEFRALGCTPMISDYDLVETCFHKYRMYELLREYGIPTARCWRSVAEFERDAASGTAAYPAFVKPENGSASMLISRCDNREELRFAAAHCPELLIQEYMPGQEYGVDAYVDMLSGRCVSIFIKKKLKMRAGETDKAVSVRDDRLAALVRAFAERAGFRGQIDIDVFAQDGVYYISEVNPRYGGGYPHAYLCGVDTPSLYIANLEGRENPPESEGYEAGIAMMKYVELTVRRVEEA